MRQHDATLERQTAGRGLSEITDAVAGEVAASGIRTGACSLLAMHTSASLLIQENADPLVLRDLEAFFSRLVPDADVLYHHVAEGPDDMPAHVRSALTQASLVIPVAGGRLRLGTWQGIFLWEHRTEPHLRRIALHAWGT